MLPRGAGPRRDGRSRALQRRFGALGRRGRAQRKPPPSGSPLRSTGAAQSESSCGRATQNASTPHAAIRSVSCQIRQPVAPHTSRHAGARLHSEPPCCFGRRWSLESDGHNAGNKGNGEGNRFRYGRGANGKGRWLRFWREEVFFPAGFLSEALHVASPSEGGRRHASRRPIRASDEPRGRALNCAQLEVSTGTCCAARRHGQDAGPPADFVAFRGRE